MLSRPPVNVQKYLFYRALNSTATIIFLICSVSLLSFGVLIILYTICTIYVLGGAAPHVHIYFSLLKNNICFH